MLEIGQTEEFTFWFSRLRDRRATARISMQIDRVRAGQLGDVRYFDGIAELRVDYGPGYRVYFVRRGDTIIILLCGGDKSTQSRDIARARALAQEV